jgi:hypothetical protein
VTQPQASPESSVGALRVWWIPQIPGKPFHAPVADLLEGKKVLDVLAKYDLFQLAHNIKPDFCNAGGLECFSQDGDGEWCEWYDPETGNNIDEWPEAAS